MSATEQLKLFAHYNRLMNQRQYAAAGKLSETDLQEDKGAFFKSVIGTLNHIMVGDILWLKRFADHPAFANALAYIGELKKPESLGEILFADLGALAAERERIDSLIVQWVGQLSDEDMDVCIPYTSLTRTDKSFSKPLLSLLNHLFLHQVHHRGQVTTLLSQCGVDFGETDIIEFVNDCDVSLN